MNSVQQLNENQLAQYLGDVMPGFGKLLNASKFAGGQSNPTFLLETGDQSYVLRRKPPGQLLKSAHAVDREYRVMSALAHSQVPVPDVYHLCDDDSVIGSMFFVMAYVEGRIFWDPTLPELVNSERAGIYDAMNQVLAALHEVDVHAVGLADFGRPGNYFERQVKRWTSQYRASETERIDAMESLVEWLAVNLPEDDGQVGLVHGDYRLDNMVVHPQETRVIAVLDWELSTVGHPIADLAYQCMQWRLPSGAGALRGLQEVDRSALGIPTEEEYVAAYCERRGIGAIEHWHYYLAVSFFRLAAICQGVYKRALDGTASSAKATSYGDATKQIAATALPLIN